MSITCTGKNALKDKTNVRISSSNRRKTYNFSLRIENKRDFTKKTYNFVACIVTDITRKGEIRINVSIENETQLKDNLDSQNIFSEMSYDDCKQMSIELTKNISNYLKINDKHIDDYFSRECFYAPCSKEYIDKECKFFAFESYNLILPVAKKFLDYAKDLVKCKKSVFTSEEDYLIWEKALTDKSFDPKTRNRIISSLVEYILYSIEVEKTDKNLKDILNDDKNIDEYRIRNQDDYIKYLEKELWK